MSLEVGQYIKMKRYGNQHRRFIFGPLRIVDVSTKLSCQESDVTAKFLPTNICHQNQVNTNQNILDSRCQEIDALTMLGLHWI